jgi:hypothetical protein
MDLVKLTLADRLNQVIDNMLDNHNYERNFVELQVIKKLLLKNPKHSEVIKKQLLDILNEQHA